MKKTLRFTFISLGIGIIGIGAFMLTKSTSTKHFDKNVRTTVMNMYLAAYIAESSTNEYSNIWRREIKAGYSSIYVDGEERYFSDFSEAVNYKVQKFKDAGVLNNMDSVMTASKQFVKNIDASFFGSDETKKCVKDLYLNVSEYCSLANSPEGSLQSFNNKRNELSNNISRNMNELKLYMPE